ncbi:MAG: sulfatase-like hydrolase/transferase, partial [Kofleriaceae bacterium]
MAWSSSVRSRLATTGRWLAPSLVCACAGTLAAGLVEGLELGGLAGAAAATGFLGLLAIPALFALGVAVRAIYAAWRPRVVLDGLIEEDGAAPRLAGWAAMMFFGTLGLAWAMFQGTWLLASWTAFKPMTLGFAQPVLAVGAALVLVAISRPGASLFAWIARRIDRRWRRGGRRTLLRPWPIFAGTGALALATTYALWLWIVRPRLGPVDTSLLHGPAAALVVTALGHAAWRALRGRLRPIAGVAIAAATAAAVAYAAIAVRTRPSLALQLGGDQPLAGLAIERLFELDEIRARISLTEFRPVARPGAPHPDIVLITIDTVRADRTPPYGGPAEMPVLQQLGQRGTVFVNAFAPSNVTRRSIPSMITGLQPNRIRGRVVGWALRIDPRHVLVAERLRAGGYETAGFMCCKGFWGAEARTGLGRGLEHVEIEPDGLALAKRARAWLEARERSGTRKPLFLWMHVLEPHNWTITGGEVRSESDKRKIYDRTLTASDAMLREVLSAFADRPADQAPISIVTADHGESLGDHGAPYHSTDLYNSNLSVPFV